MTKKGKRGGARSKVPGAGKTRRQSDFAIREPGETTWEPCDQGLNGWINRAIEDFERGQPGSITVRDEDGEPHTLSGAAGRVVYLALLAMDARLRPERGYREKADKVYEILAGGPSNEDGIQELRKVFMLGAKRPLLMK